MADQYQLLGIDEPAFDQVLTRLLAPTSILDKRNRSLRSILGLLKRRLNAKQVLVEERYIDVDYLNMYSGWYSSSFKQHSPLTTRLHFFAKDDIKLEQIVTGNVDESKYLGYVVITPLIYGRVGRTVIRTWEGSINIDGKTHFPKILKARAVSHLYGCKFSVEGMPFLSQDSLTIACAQASIWMTSRFMHLKYGRYGLARHLPNSITESASQNLTWAGRPLPSEGLSIFQVINAFVNLGFFPEFNLWKHHEHSNRERALSWIVRYLDSDLPVLLILGELKHAIVAVGQLLSEYRLTPTANASGATTASGWVGALVINDDGPGPYLIMPRTQAQYDSLKAGTDNDLIPPDAIPEWWKSFEDVDGFIVPLPQEVSILAKHIDEIVQVALDANEQQNPIVYTWVHDSAEDPKRLALRYFVSALSGQNNSDRIVTRAFLIRSMEFLRKARLTFPESLWRFYVAQEYPLFVWVIELTVESRVQGKSPSERLVFGELVIDSTAHRSAPSFLFAHVGGSMVIRNPNTERIGRRFLDGITQPYKGMLS